MFSESQLILSHIPSYGGSSFVEATIAFNLIMSSWAQLQTKLNDLQSRLDESIMCTAAYIADMGPSQTVNNNRILRTLLLVAGTPIVNLAHAVWRTVWILSIVNLIIGVIVLYYGIEHWLLVLLIAHIAGYFACTVLLLLWAKFTAWAASTYFKMPSNIDILNTFETIRNDPDQR